MSKKQALRQAHGDDWKDKAAGKIAGTALKWQIRFSVAINKLLATLPANKLKTSVLIFCLCGCGFSFYLIANAIVSKPAPSLRIDSVHTPKHFDKAGDEIMENSVDSSLYLQIQEYKRYMDSTKQTIRPSLLDSIKMLEEIYLSQQNK